MSAAHPTPGTSTAPASAARFKFGNSGLDPIRATETNVLDATESAADQEKSNACGGDPLGSPPHETRSRIPVPNSEFGTVSRDDSADSVAPVTPGGDVWVPVVSTDAQRAEAVAFADDWYAAESAGMRQHARDHGAVFSLMQYREHGDTGVTLLTQEQLDGGLAWLEAEGFADARYADIWHGLDRYTEDEVAKAARRGRAVSVGELKPLHAHAALWIPGADLSVRQVSRVFGLPASRVELGRDFVKRRGGAAYRGRTAAADTFFDLCAYLVHETPRAQAEGKHPYQDAAVRANFPFRAELDANRAGLAARRAGGRAGDGMKGRVRALRRAVLTGEMTLDDARAADLDAYAEDLPRLEKLRADHDRRASELEAARIGVDWRKSLVLITGPTRNGKDVLASAIGRELVRIAALAGHEWSYVKPAGKNSLEGVGRAEIVHHEDMRYRLLPDYDEALRYFDPNQATAASGRFHNRSAPTPRVTLATSSETLLSLAFTLKRRVDTDDLVAQRAAADASRDGRPPAIDVDEFLYRVVWYVDVRKPADAGADYDRIVDGAMVSISRVVEGPGDHRVMTVRDRADNAVGDVRTRHRIEPVAMIRGIEHAARFLAASLIAERSPDVVAAMPADADWDAITADLAAIESAGSAALDAEASLVDYCFVHRVRLSPPGERWSWGADTDDGVAMWGPPGRQPVFARADPAWSRRRPPGEPLPPPPVPVDDTWGDLARGVTGNR